MMVGNLMNLHKRQSLYCLRFPCSAAYWYGAGMDRETAASERGLHYVVAAAADKRPLAKGWLRCAASAEEVEAAPLIPGS